MRFISPVIFASHPSRYDFQIMMTSRGYSSHAAGGSGGEIMFRPGSNIYWKIADDTATEEFADFMASAASDPALPLVFAVSPKGSPYTILAMERLIAFPHAAA